MEVPRLNFEKDTRGLTCISKPLESSSISSTRLMAMDSKLFFFAYFHFDIYKVSVVKVTAENCFVF